MPVARQEVARSLKKSVQRSSHGKFRRTATKVGPVFATVLFDASESTAYFRSRRARRRPPPARPCELVSQRLGSKLQSFETWNALLEQAEIAHREGGSSDPIPSASGGVWPQK